MGGLLEWFILSGHHQLYHSLTFLLSRHQQNRRRKSKMRYVCSPSLLISYSNVERYGLFFHIYAHSKLFLTSLTTGGTGVLSRSGAISAARSSQRCRRPSYFSESLFIGGESRDKTSPIATIHSCKVIIEIEYL